MSTDVTRGAMLMQAINDGARGVDSPWVAIRYDELADMMAVPGEERLIFPRGGFPELICPSGRVRLFPSPHRPPGPVVVVSGMERP